MTVTGTPNEEMTQDKRCFSISKRLLALIAALVTTATTIASAQDVHAQETVPTFDVFEYRVLNNTMLTPDRIERVLYPHLGPKKTFEDVQGARAALEKEYRDAGFSTVFVDVPEQDVDEGIVRLAITEGRIDRVRVTGTRYFGNRQIVSEAPSLQKGGVPHFPTVQSDLQALNSRTRDRGVTPVLRAGRTPGTVDVELKVVDELPLHGALEVNDRYTANTSRTRASVNLSYDNLWQSFHSMSIQYQATPEELREARVFAATYVAPLANRHVLAIYGVDTNSEVATIGSLSVLGAGRIYGTRYIIPFPGTSDYSHSLTLGGDYKDFNEDLVLSADTALSTPIEYINWSLVYGGNARSETSLFSYNVGANFGIRGLVNDPESFENKRFKAKPNYFYLRADANEDHRFLLGTRLALRVSGQYSTEPLISNEQYSIGGEESVRGYLEAAELGDYGISGSVELRSPSFTRWMKRADVWYVYLFGDGGVVRIVDALPQQSTHANLWSWGAGLKFAGFSGFEMSLDWAYPMEASGSVTKGDTRFHFRARYGF